MRYEPVETKLASDTRGATLLEVAPDLLELLNTRVVIPMTKAPALAKKPVSHLTPEVSFNSDRYVLLTPQLASDVQKDVAVPVRLWNLCGYNDLPTDSRATRGAAEARCSD